jgi:hypothetical protein
LEQANKSHNKKKSKPDRLQGRNPLPRTTIQTNSVETQTKFHAPLESVEIETRTGVSAIVDTIVQTEEVFFSPK